MNVLNQQSRLILVFLLGIFLVAATACGSSGNATSPATGPTATQQPTATPITSDTFGGTPTIVPTRPSAVEPYPTSTPTPLPPPPMQVVLINSGGFGEPVAGTVFEDLLVRLPDNESTRSYAVLSDYAGVMEALGIVSPEPGTDTGEDALVDYFDRITETFQRVGFAPGLPVWPQAMRDYISVTEWFPYVGFDIWSVEQSAHAGRQPSTYDIAFGDFDPERTANMLAACDCDQPTIRTHEGVEYYSWGTEFIGEIEKRHGPPIYDYVGRGPRLLIEEGVGYYAIPNAVMEDYIDVSQGNQPSLAEDQAYIDVTRAMAALGLTREMSFYSAQLSVEEASLLDQNPALFVETVTRTALLEQFGMVATSIGFDGEKAFTGMVISNPDAATAELNATLLIERIKNVPISTRTDTTFADQLERVEIGVEGNLVVARFYYHDSSRINFGLPILFGNTVFLYE